MGEAGGHDYWPEVIMARGTRIGLVLAVHRLCLPGKEDELEGAAGHVTLREGRQAKTQERVKRSQGAWS